PRGRRPLARVRRRYEWCYVYAFVRPATGQSWWCLLPTLRAAAFAAALREFARDEGIGPERRAVLVVDGAGWPAAAGLAVREGAPSPSLPPSSPGLQPAGRLWPLVDEPVANRAFADFADLEDALAERCRTLRDDRRRVKARTRFHWWPRERR